MATIKSYTDISQSKKLAEILPLESADMHYGEYCVSGENYPIPNCDDDYNGHCCWSLAALLGVLPDCPDLSKHTDNKWYITTYPNGVHTCLMGFDNPVDACVAMIEKLND